MKKKSSKTKNNKYVKYIVIGVVALAIIVLGVLIYKNLFSGSNSNRLEGIENYKLTKTEINDVKDELKKIESVDSIDVYTNVKIIKILVNLKDDVEFDTIKDVSNKSIEKISEKNREFYDIEIYVKSNNEKSEVYPKIGYKYKTSSEFVWSR